MRTKFDIHTKSYYTRESIEDIIRDQCEKKNYPVPNFGHGYLSNVARDMDIKPQGKYGHSFYYLGKDVIPLINKVLENRAKKKGETKQRTGNSPSNNQTVVKPSQISIDDISRNSKYDQLIDKLMDCIGIIESMKETI